MSEQQKKTLQNVGIIVSTVVAIIMTTLTLSANSTVKIQTEKMASLEVRQTTTERDMSEIKSMVSGYGSKLDQISSGQDAILKMFVAHIEKGSGK